LDDDEDDHPERRRRRRRVDPIVDEPDYEEDPENEDPMVAESPLDP
jgi:hypothetical protein